MTDLLRAEGVTVDFGSGASRLSAVSNVDLEIASGETVGIVGESGSGKSTLARALVGLQRVTSGSVVLDGKTISVAGSDPKYSKQDRWKVQMVFQDPYTTLNPRLRAWQGVADGLAVWQGLGRRASRHEAYELLASLGITTEQANSYPSALSGGQMQRVSVARALTPRPKVLVTDEATSSIDQSAQAQLLNILKRLQRENDLALLFISHNLELVRYISHRVYVMQSGKVVETGPTGAVFENPTDPYTRLLISSVPSRRSRT
jgi:ABC-type dipeptide/oligopeptide/nickel transport system ATPase subunit